MLTELARVEWERETNGVDRTALLDGSLRIVELVRSGPVCRAVVTREPIRMRLSPRERSVLERLCDGATQKALSYELGIALTTVSAHLRVALDKLGLSRWEHAVLAALILEGGGSAARGLSGAPVPASNRDVWVVRAELRADLLRALTSAEREVALLVVDGLTNFEIGCERKSSPRTVANQVAAVFRKLSVHGRLELIRKLVTSTEPSEASSSPESTAEHGTYVRELGATHSECAAIAE